jgi:hypothetical protein
MNHLSDGNTFITKFTAKFSPTLFNKSVFHVGVIRDALKCGEPCRATPLTVNWDQMAHGTDNCCLLLTNHKHTPIDESHCSPRDIILCRSVQVIYFPSFQTSSAVKHAESLIKLACASRPAMHSMVTVKLRAVNASSWYGMVFTGAGFPMHCDLYVVYCTSPMNFQLSRLSAPAQCTAYLPKNSGIQLSHLSVSKVDSAMTAPSIREQWYVT